MLKLAVVFGGMSTEHDVSIVSGLSVLRNLEKELYDILPIYIDEEGNWFVYDKNIEDIEIVEVGDKLTDLKPISNPMEYLKNVDCIFPVLHGLYGEDGTIQGLFELLKKPYVGCKVLASSVSMDKAYTKIIFEKAGLKQVNHVYLRKEKEEYIYIDDSLKQERFSLEDIAKKVEEKISYPMFVKPSNSGSSVGINKATNQEELKEDILFASQYDKKIIIEQGLDVREVECAVLGNDDLKASPIGEILSAEEFYSFDSKYKNAQSKTVIPANVSQEVSEEIRAQAKRAFQAVDGSGLARVDFS